MLNLIIFIARTFAAQAGSQTREAEGRIAPSRSTFSISIIMILGAGAFYYISSLQRLDEDRGAGAK
jgi:hypothetical protein